MSSEQKLQAFDVWLQQSPWWERLLSTEAIQFARDAWNAAGQAVSGAQREYDECHSNLRFCEKCGIVHTEKFPCPLATPATAQLSEEQVREAMKASEIQNCLDGQFDINASLLATKLNALLRAQPAQPLQPQIEELRELSEKATNEILRRLADRNIVIKDAYGHAAPVMTPEEMALIIKENFRKWLAPTEEQRK